MGLNLDRITRPDLPRIEIYGDESMDRGAYDVLGALWIPADEAVRLRSEIADLRAQSAAPHPTSEMKWTKCSGSGSHPLYDSVIDLVMERIRRKKVRFKCMVIERALVDNKAWNAGDQELGFFKAWHALLRSRIMPGLVYNIRLDARQLQKANRLSDLRDVLRNCGLSDHEEIDYWCVGTVESRDSKSDDLIQVVDLLTGAVGFHYCRGEQQPGASQRKVDFAARIAKHLGWRTLRVASVPSDDRFNVWKWKPRRAKAQRAP